MGNADKEHGLWLYREVLSARRGRRRTRAQWFKGASRVVSQVLFQNALYFDLRHRPTTRVVDETHDWPSKERHKTPLSAPSCGTESHSSSSGRRQASAVRSKGNNVAARDGGNDDDCHQGGDYPSGFVSWSSFTAARGSGRNILAGSVRERDRLSPDSLRRIRDLSQSDRLRFREQFDELDGSRNSITEAEYNARWRALNR